MNANLHPKGTQLMNGIWRMQGLSLGSKLLFQGISMVTIRAAMHTLLDQNSQLWIFPCVWMITIKPNLFHVWHWDIRKRCLGGNFLPFLSELPRNEWCVICTVYKWMSCVRTNFKALSLRVSLYSKLPSLVQWVGMVVGNNSGVMLLGLFERVICY